MESTSNLTVSQFELVRMYSVEGDYHFAWQIGQQYAHESGIPAEGLMPQKTCPICFGSKYNRDDDNNPCEWCQRTGHVDYDTPYPGD